MRYTHLVTRVLTKDGVDRESELRLPEGLEILELRTIKADGSVFYPANIDHKSSISLSGIGVGDFIDEEHIEYLPPSSYDRDGFDASMTFVFQGVDRIYHHSELVLIYPEGLEPEPVLLSRNMPVEPQIETRNGLKTVRWLTQNMPPFHQEADMPPFSYLQPAATFYYNTTWEEIRDFYYNAMRTRMGLAAPLKQKIAEWRATDLDRRALAEAVYTEVVDYIEPESSFYTNVNLVWENRSGNATLLLTALLQALEYECDIVFVHPEQMRHYIFDTPMPSFSYALLRLKIGDETVWLDPNNKGVPFGYIPFSYRGSVGMVLNPDQPLHDTVPRFTDESERIETAYQMYFRENGSVTGKGSEKFFGVFAARLKERYARLNRPEIKQRIEAGINQTFPGAVVSDVAIPEDQPRGEFEMTNEFRHDSLADADENTLAINYPLPRNPFLEEYGSLAERTTPLLISEPHYNRATVEMQLPEQYAWQSKEVVHRYDSKFGTYELAVEIDEKQKLTLKRTYHIYSQFVSPEDYKAFQAFCRDMLSNEDLVLRAARQGNG